MNFPRNNFTCLGFLVMSFEQQLCSNLQVAGILLKLLQIMAREIDLQGTLCEVLNDSIFFLIEATRHGVFV
jgi:hypothetical protein